MGNDFKLLGWMLIRLIRCFGTFRGKGKPFYRDEFARSFSRIGADSLPIVSVIAACTGIILALQSAQQLERLGALSYVASFVGVTIVMELGPLLTAIIIAGRSGASFAAEIATMQISEEVDALEVMGLDPVRVLVLPKFLAMIVMVPALTAWADFIGIFAGGLFSSAFLGIAADTYFEQTIVFLKVRHFFSGIVKSLGFSVAITVIGCWQGFLAFRGAADVGSRTTRAVVQSIFMIILLDLYFTALNYVFR